MEYVCSANSAQKGQIMTRSMFFIWPVTLAILAVSVGCIPPSHLPPVPSEASSQNLVRVMAIPREAVLPKVLDVLVDLGYQIRCVNQDLGQVNIYRAWTEKDFLGNPLQYSVEATLLFRPDGPQSTRARVIIESQSRVDGRQILDPALCQTLLQNIESALRPNP